MKTKATDFIKCISLLIGLLIITFSCKYDEIADMDYPDSLIYIPAALDGIHSIDDLNEEIADFATGAAYTYVIDKENNQFIIPLAAYRSGLNTGGTVKINLWENYDLIGEEIWSSLEEAEIIPSGNFSFDSSIEIPSGERVAPFNLITDFTYLYNQYPKQVYVAIRIDAENAEVNPDLSTVVVLIETKIMKPELQVESIIENTDRSLVVFSNNTKYGVAYSWDFGDGSAVSNEVSPSHRYTSPGTYSVTLTAEGIYGDTVSENIEVTIRE